MIYVMKTSDYDDNFLECGGELGLIRWKIKIKDW